jgi:uncharacterized membrane protein YfcA
MELIGYVSLILVGITLSLIGGGGSMLSIPILVYLFSLDVITASSYSLFIVGTTSLIGAWLKQREHRLDTRAGITFVLSSAVAIFCTRTWIIPRIPETLFVGEFIVTKHFLIMSVFVLLAIASAIAALLQRSLPTEGRQTNLRLLAPAGLGTGMLVGFVGAGGGFLILPSLTLFAGLPFKLAIGTTLIIIGVNSLLGFVGDVMIYHINWTFLLIITSLSTLGMLLGNFYSRRMETAHLRRSFGWIVLTIAIGVIFTELIF